MSFLGGVSILTPRYIVEKCLLVYKFEKLNSNISRFKSDGTDSLHTISVVSSVRLPIGITIASSVHNV